MKILILVLLMASINAFSVTLLSNGSNTYTLNITETSSKVYDVGLTFKMGTFEGTGYSFITCSDVGVKNFSLSGPTGGLSSFMMYLYHGGTTDTSTVIPYFYPFSLRFDGASSYYRDSITSGQQLDVIDSEVVFTNTSDANSVTMSLTGVSDATLNYLNFPNTTEDSYWKCWGSWAFSDDINYSSSTIDFAGLADVTSGNVIISKDYASGFTSLFLTASAIVSSMY